MQSKLEKKQHSENNISKTGYRALLLLFTLIKKPHTRDELIKLLAKDPIIGKNLSKDTISNTIIALREAGTLIIRPSQRTNFKYILKNHPFNTYLPKDSIKALQILRQNIVSLEDWELLIKINDFYAKLAEFAPDEESKNTLLYKHPLNNIDFQIVNTLKACANLKKSVEIIYKSPKNGLEKLIIKPEKIFFKDEKLYIWCYSDKVKSNSYLKIENIKSIQLLQESISDIKESDNYLFISEYKLKGFSALTYVDNEYEEIISSKQDEELVLHIKSKVKQKFNFYQKIMSYGTDCEILEPKEIKTEILDILKKIKENYE